MLVVVVYCWLWLVFVAGCSFNWVVNSVELAARFYSVWIVACGSAYGFVLCCVFGFDCCLTCGGYFCMVLEVGVGIIGLGGLYC